MFKLEGRRISVAALFNYLEQKLSTTGNECLQHVICLPNKLIWALTFDRERSGKTSCLERVSLQSDTPWTLVGWFLQSLDHQRLNSFKFSLYSQRKENKMPQAALTYCRQLRTLAGDSEHSECLRRCWELAEFIDHTFVHKCFKISFPGKPGDILLYPKLLHIKFASFPAVFTLPSLSKHLLGCYVLGIHLGSRYMQLNVYLFRILSLPVPYEAIITK